MPSIPLIFTVCSINQLANAFVLGDSIKVQHPHYQYFIGLVDKESNIPKSIKSPYPIIDIDKIEIPAFNEMAEKYTYDELTADCKPFFAKYFIQKSDKVIYFDCTSFVYHTLDFITQTLDNQDIILVPQLLYAGKHPDEKQILNSGIYHAGFFALKQTSESTRFLNWWSNNTQNKGFRDLCKGLNADQLWLEHVPALFDNVYIEKHEGLNIGTWNLSERKIQYTDNQPFINNKPVISINFKELKYWKKYEQGLNKYSNKNIEKVKPNFGLPNPIEKPTQKFIANKVRKINNVFDWILDKI
ncbi:hypothetical protein [Emticicia sp. SJ17W-69]|uniref:hypothetical protein n=1 Tax=Emticicia sp. SJ17W-69 TaxID=3421657 RepID=UPI003EB88BD2